MRLLLVTQDFPPQVGGIETYCRELAKVWHQQVDDFAVLTVARKGFKDVEEAFDQTLPYKVYRTPAKTGASLGFLWQRNCPSFLKKHAFTHIFHAQWQTAIPSIRAKANGSIAAYYVALHGRELLFNPYKNWPFLGTWYQERMKQSLSGATKVFSNSHFSASLVHRANIQTKVPIDVTGLAVNWNHYQTTTREQAIEWMANRAGKLNGTVLLSLCRLIQRKGVGTCLKAIRLFLDQHPNYLLTYCVAGHGPDEKRLKQMSTDLGLEEVVRFIGNVNTKNLPYAYGASDLFMMPSRNRGSDVEGFGLVFLEAAAAGIPSIGSTDGGIPDAVLDGETGLLVPPKNPKRLSNALEKILMDTAYRKQLGNAAYERAKALSWEQLANKIMSELRTHSTLK